MRVVNQREPCALSSAVLGSEPEDRHLVFVHFVGFCQFCTEVFFGHVCTVGMKHVAFLLFISMLATCRLMLERILTRPFAFVLAGHFVEIFACAALLATACPP